MYRQYLFKALFSAIIGTIVTFVAVILGIYSPKLVIWILSILLPLSGWIISSKWPDEWWKISCGLVFPFLLYLTWLLVSILQYNSRYEGQFWRSEFFLISIFLYAMPAVLPFFAARI